MITFKSVIGIMIVVALILALGIICVMFFELFANYLINRFRGKHD